MANTPFAVIVGASRGLGLGLVEYYLEQGWRVLATTRDAVPKGEIAALALKTDMLETAQVDVNEPTTVQALLDRVKAQTVDLLFINAGVSNSADDWAASTTDEIFVHIMKSNMLGPIRALHTLIDLVKQDGTAAVMSTDLASSASTCPGWEIYSASKAGMNLLLRHAVMGRPEGDRRTYLCMAPGWVRTDMGGMDADLDVATAVAGLADTINTRKGSGGLAFVDYTNQELPW